MRASSHIFFCLIAFFFCTPFSAFADTIIDSDIFEDTTWTEAGSPYLVQGEMTIDQNATLSIEPGVIVQVDSGGIDVLGRLLAVGTPDEPVLFTSDAIDWGGIEFSNQDAASSLNHVVIRYASTAIFDYYSKELSISNTKVEESDYGIDAYGSHLLLNNFSAENISRDAIDIYESDVTLKNITLKNVGAGVGIYTDSKADIFNLFIDQSYYEALALYEKSAMHVSSSTLTNGARDGVGIYGGSAFDMQDSVISGFLDGAGIANYDYWPDDPANSLSLTNNDIYDNAIGISMYSRYSSYVISNNSIHDNILYGFELYGPATVDVSHNFWGNLSGPYSNPDNLSGKGDEIVYASGSTITFSPWLSYWGTPPVSNVLFLPGIEGSRLYEGTGCGKSAEEKLWEPIGESFLKILRGAGDDKVKGLFLDQAGESVCNDIYVKADDIIDSVKGNTIYKSFIDEMNGLESNDIINDWKPVAYDWRLSLDDLLNNGAERDGKIFYEKGDKGATSTPYIEQTLRALAASSQTGKVTIIAHSNGGLVAKALLDKLGDGGAATLVDKFIMVGAPQSGAPAAVGALLYGLDQGISSWGIPILHSSVARELAQNSPMAYHLLPSGDYLESIAADTAHRVARFAGDAYAAETGAYGSTIDNRTELDDFLLAESLNPALIDYANSVHAALDFWTPPAGIEVSQIAGWGADTVAGIDFYTLSGVSALSSLAPVRMYRPIFIEDGDGTVPVPSALMMASSTNVKRYWLNLFSYNDDTNSNRKHRDIFEIPQIEDFVKNIIKNSTSMLPSYISSSQPATITDNKKLTFLLHSPLTLQLTDSSGNITGLAEDGSMTQDIPDSTYGEFGDVKYIIVPQGSQYQLTMQGKESGTFSLDIQESSGGIITASSTIANVPTTENTLASITISGGLDTISALTVDENGDGIDIITITPEVGETVNYEPPAAAVVPVLATPELVVSSARGGGGRRRISSSAAVPALVAVTNPLAMDSTNSPQATIQTVPANEPVMAATKPVQIKKKVPVAVAPPKKVNINIPQTASVYEASQQSVLTKVGTMVYNNLRRIWRGLKVIFLIQK